MDKESLNAKNSLKNFREQLKIQTQQEHDNLEGASRITKDNFTMVEYQKILTAWYAFYSAFEGLINHYQDQFPEIYEFMKKRTKIPLLESDLRHFALNTSTEKKKEAFDFLSPLFRDKSALWGALYVTEGSTLGAQFITRHLAHKFNLSSDKGIQFYNGYGNATGQHWKEFVEKLQALDLTEEEKEKGVETAKKAFQFFARYFNDVRSISIRKDGALQ